MKKVLLIGLLMVCCCTSFSQTGVLDQTFGSKGKRVMAFANYPSFVDLAIQPDGKILLLLENLLIRYNSNGYVDASFAINGKLILNFNETSIAVQQDGKIVTGGEINNFTTNKFIVGRYSNNGKPDSTFGSNGFVVTDITAIASNTSLSKVLVRANGRILASGAGISYAGKLITVQYLSNGMIDSTFGVNGILYSNSTNQIYKMRSSLMSNGKLIMVANSIDSIVIAQFLQNGIPDTNFGQQGFAKIDFSWIIPNSFSVMPDGKIIMAGKKKNVIGSSKIGLVRLKSNGSIDTSFGQFGHVVTSLSDSEDVAYKVHALPDKKIIVSGGENQYYNGNFVLLKYTENGNLDSTFGKKGIVKTNFPRYASLSYGSLIQNDGKILLAGALLDSSYIRAIGIARYENNGPIKYNSITGTVFLDQNKNGIKENTESYFNNANIITSKSGDSINTRTNSGKFLVDVDTGFYETKVLPYLPYYTITPSHFATLHSNYFNTDSVSFAVQPLSGKRNLAINLVSRGIARDAYQTIYDIVYQNFGTDTVTAGTLVFNFSNKLQYSYADTTPSTVLGNKLTWSISNLKPLGKVSIRLYFFLKPPPVANIGDTLVTTASITSNMPDLNPSDNSAYLLQFVKASFDPNDKTENHGGKITNTQVANGEYMQYTIRFQNTGNDTAFNVYIHDTLDSKLNWNTLQIITASHNYQMNLSDGKCLFKFPGINLVDSIHNEPGSHGYIVYRVKPLPTVQIGDVIKNTAAIYFDYNLPIYTKTEITTVVAETFPLKLLNFTAKKQDKANLLNWTTTNEVNVDHFEIERSGNGKEFADIGMTPPKIT